MQDKEVMNTKEAAAFLRLSAFTVREYAKQGTIPAKRIGGRWRFYLPDLVEWVRKPSHLPQEEGETMTPEEMAAVQRGIEDIKEGRFVSLEEYRDGKRP